MRDWLIQWRIPQLKGWILLILVHVFQDYSDARSVLVRGRATLKLQTNKHTINMDSYSTEVINC